MRILQMMLNAFRPLRKCSSKRRRFVRREMEGGDGAAAREEEAKLAKSLREARDANAHVAMGAIVSAGQAMAAESRTQAFLRGMLREIDKGRDHDGRL